MTANRRSAPGKTLTRTYVNIYTRRQEGAKAPSLLDHLELLFQTFEAKVLDLRNLISDAKALNRIRRLG